MAAVAAVDAPTFATVIEPLMNAPHFKTNKAICEAKFLQHCSTNSILREAADGAGARFAKLKALHEPLGNFAIEALVSCCDASTFFSLYSSKASSVFFHWKVSGFAR